MQKYSTRKVVQVLLQRSRDCCECRRERKFCLWEESVEISPLNRGRV